MDLRSNLSKARGLGSAHEGAHHWWMQRVTAVALIPLVLWFVSSVIKATSVHGVEGVMYLLSSPLNAILMILFLGTAIYHGTLGVKVIIEDYVHCQCASKFLDIAIKFIQVISIVAVTFAIFFVHIKTYGNPERFQSGLWNVKGSCHKNINGNVENPNSNTSKEGAALSAQPQNEAGKAPATVIETPQE